MGARIRAHDWAANPLGLPAAWPPALRTLVAVMLGSRQAMFVAWGSERTMLYNDGYAAICGSPRHPAALGRRFREVWFDIMDDVGPILDRAYAGEGTHMDDLPLTMIRNGRTEQTYFSFSYSPVRDEAGEVTGMFCACTETTAQVMAERQRQAELAHLLALFDQAPGFICALRGPDHVFERVNAAHRALMGGRDLTGLSVREALPELAAQGFYDLLDGVRRSGEPYVGKAQRVLLRRAPDAPPEERFLDFIYQPVRDADGQVTGILCEGMDVTDAVRAQAALRESEERLRLIVEGAQDYAIFVADAEDRIEAWMPGAVRVFGWCAEEVTGQPAAVIFTPEDRAAGVPEREIDTARREGVAPNNRWHLHRDGRRVFIEGGVTTLRRDDGSIRGFLKIGQDVTARKAAEERQALLAREVDHRAKNALAVVQSMLRLTRAADVKSFARAVEGRVSALARAQTLLAAESWHGADLRALLEGELAPFLGGQRAELEGPSVVLPPGTAQPLAMAAHELATNAAKHGALSRPEGRLAIRWNLAVGGPSRLLLRWAETGGPPVEHAPERRGFGSRVLEGTVRGQLGGAVSLLWHREGLECAIELPLAAEPPVPPPSP